MKGWVGCNDHNGSITTQKGPFLLRGKQGKKGKGKEYDTRKGKSWCGEYNTTITWETRTKEERQFPV